MSTSTARTRLPAAIAGALARGAHVLTSTPRAARWLKAAFAEDARAQGLRGWAAPPIEDWDSWTAKLYAGLAAERDGLPLLLTDLQEQLLWKQVQVEDAAAVVSPERLAQLAQEAYRLLGAYDAHGNRRAPWAAAHDDAERFLAWADSFDRLCQDLDVASPSQVELLLRKYARQIQVAPAAAPEILLVGFDRLTPAQAGLAAALEQHGLQMQHIRAAAPAAQQRLLYAADEAAELEACALWVRQQLEHNPTQRIGVLLPELRGAQAAVDRAFRRVLLPDSAAAAAAAPPFEFSLGAPLASVPLVNAALPWLRWLAGPLPAAELTCLLLGGFAAVDAGEHRLLAQSDVALRRAGLMSTEVSLSTLLHHAGRKPDLLPHDFVQRLAGAQQWSQHAAGRRRSYAEWTEAVPALLDQLRWPGFRELGSAAYQARARWQSLLDEVALLGFAGRMLRWSEFVQELTGFTQDRLFAPESQDAPVQVMGVAEAAGQSFDAIWLLQAAESRWPPSGRMHPLLAPAVQRDAGMPHATAEADLQLAELQMRRVLASAPLMIASCARQSAGVDNRPSPLLSICMPAAAWEATPPQRPAPPCELLRQSDTPVAAPWPVDRIAGGSEVLKRQAACGFQSFAVKRLNAVAIEEEAWGLDAGERAILLHRALEHLWSTEPVDPDADQLHSREDLYSAIGSGAIDAMLQTAVERSFGPAMREADGDVWRTEYLLLERQRLCARLRAWLDVEQERADFAVTHLEQKLEGLHIGPLRLNLRLDRADTVADGCTLLLDYKTAARVSMQMWSGERPDEPQLPIYALFGGIANVAGIAFAQIRAGVDTTKLHALAEDPVAQLGGTPPKEGAKPDRRELTAAMRDEWTHALLTLAEAFAKGEAPVNPKHGDQTCSLCGLYGVCRIRSQANAIGMVADEAEAGDA